MIDDLKGTRLRKLGFELLKRGDIYYFEGPYLSHFKDERGFDYLLNWVDLNDNLNRWLLFSVNSEILNKYFSRKATLLELVKKGEQGAVYLLDINGEATIQKIWIVEIDDIPDAYLPKEESFFDPTHSENYALEFAKENKKRLVAEKSSFIEKTIKKLFQTNQQLNLDIDLISTRINNPWNRDPDFINELAISQSLMFPLIVHYHSSKDRIIRDLILTHSQAMANHIEFKSYMSQVHAAVVAHSGVHISVNQRKDDVEFLWNEVFNSTLRIVKSEPTIYVSLYNDWLDTIKGEYKCINELHQFVKTKRRLKPALPGMVKKKG